jgi:hypothetical protein
MQEHRRETTRFTRINISDRLVRLNIGTSNSLFIKKLANKSQKLLPPEKYWYNIYVNQAYLRSKAQLKAQL